MNKVEQTVAEALFGDVRDERDWRWIVGYEGLYFATDEGRIYSLKKLGPIPDQVCNIANEIKGQISTTGYRCVLLTKDSKQRMLKAHRLIASAFHGTDGKGLDCCHLDGNRLNNCPDNLLFATRKINASHREQHGTAIRGTSVSASKLNEPQVLAIRKDNRRHFEIAKDFGVSGSLISLIKSRKLWAHLVSA